MKTVDFSELLQPVTWNQWYMYVSFEGQCHFLILAQGHLHFLKLKLAFLRNDLPFWTKFYFVLGPNIRWAFHRTIGPLVSSWFTCNYGNSNSNYDWVTVASICRNCSVFVKIYTLKHMGSGIVLSHLYWKSYAPFLLLLKVLSILMFMFTPEFEKWT